MLSCILYGSSVTRLCEPSSDVDMCLLIDTRTLGPLPPLPEMIHKHSDHFATTEEGEEQAQDNDEDEKEEDDVDDTKKEPHNDHQRLSAAEEGSSS